MPVILPGALAIDDKGQGWWFGVRDKAASGYAIQSDVLAQSRKADGCLPI